MENNRCLQVDNISVVYSGGLRVVSGVSLTIPKGEIAALLGNNGAGKTTLLKAISGLLEPKKARITEGRISYYGKPIHNAPPEQLTREGIIQVLEGRQEFKSLTVEENLRVGATTRPGKSYGKDLEMIYRYFPTLFSKKKSLAVYCSSGELQMLAIGRALMAHPKLLLLDEPSQGLAPLLIKEILNIIKSINVEKNTAMLLAEQNANMALQIAQQGYIMENGKIVKQKQHHGFPQSFS